jgi:hypothetical protein
MPDFNVRSDSVNVEAIMEQIRERIREKRGVDYTEQQIRELADVKLEKFLDPKGVRSDLLDQFRKAQPAYEPPELPNFAFEDATLFESHRAPIRWIRKLLLPFLKLLFNPNPLIQALHIQSRLNTMNAEREARRESARRALDQLHYELIHNLVVETTRLGIEVKNLKMRLESVSSRLEFNERRARALESVVVYKAPEPEERPAPRQQQQHQHQRAQQSSHAQGQAARLPQSQVPPPPAPAAAASAAAATEADASAQGATAEGPGQRSRRRRRRRGRRGGGSAAAMMGEPGATPEASQPADANAPHDAGDQADDGDDGAELKSAGVASEQLEVRRAELPPASDAGERDPGSAPIPASPIAQTRSVDSPAPQASSTVAPLQSGPEPGEAAPGAGESDSPGSDSNPQ